MDGCFVRNVCLPSCWLVSQRLSSMCQVSFFASLSPSEAYLGRRDLSWLFLEEGQRESLWALGFSNVQFGHKGTYGFNRYVKVCQCRIFRFDVRNAEWLFWEKTEWKNLFIMSTCSWTMVLTLSPLTICFGRLGDLLRLLRCLNITSVFLVDIQFSW